MPRDLLVSDGMHLAIDQPQTSFFVLASPYNWVIMSNNRVWMQLPLQPWIKTRQDGQGWMDSGFTFAFCSLKLDWFFALTFKIKKGTHFEFFLVYWLNKRDDLCIYILISAEIDRETAFEVYLPLRYWLIWELKLEVEHKGSHLDL